jgi:hypothetical protein
MQKTAGFVVSYGVTVGAAAVGVGETKLSQWPTDLIYNNTFLTHSLNHT